MTEVGCPRIATMLDQEQIERGKTAIAPHPTGVTSLPHRTGTEVADELGHRYLLRYLMASQVSEFLDGSTTRGHWVTPTPYGVEDVVAWLALFAPTQRREHVLVLRTSALSSVQGPAWIRLGQGIEYYLPHGFSKSAIVDVGVLRVG